MTVIAIAISAVPANSAIIEGYGAHSCANWIEVHQGPKTADTSTADNWVLGYLDGIAKFVDANNRMQQLPPLDILKYFHGGTILDVMEKFCLAEPSKTIEAAVALLTAELVAANGVKPIQVPATTTGSAPSR
jgi:hypothetical protein